MMAQIGGFVPAAQGGGQSQRWEGDIRRSTQGAWRRRLRAHDAEKTDFAAIAFTAPIHDIWALNHIAKIMVESSKFDPFGEPVAMADTTEPARASRWLTRTGAGLFWALVIAIVAARAVYFEPGVFNGLDRALAFARGLFAAL
jgi:hypothetical protein